MIEVITSPYSILTSPLVNYTLHLADNALVLGHRNSEWTGHGPILEQDIALSNIALDLVGQARNLYQYAALLKNDGSTEDTLAYLRDAHEFKSCLLVEQSNGDWAKTICRQFFFSVYQYFLYQQLQSVEDVTIRSIAEKALKEVSYHVRWSSEWVIRLGDGTEESRTRMNKAVNELWKYTDELFTPTTYETDVAAIWTGVDPAFIKPLYKEKIDSILSEATLTLPANVKPNSIAPGKEGKHTEELTKLLAEMQFLQRTYPGCEW